MDADTFRILHDDARTALSEGRLLDALHALGGLTAGGPLAEEAERLTADYALLLDYMRRGVADPQRMALRRQFSRKACLLLSASRHRHLAGGQGHFAELSRRVAERPDGDAQSDAEFFEAVLTAAPWSAARYEHHSALLNATATPQAKRLLLLSACMLSLNAFFDPLRLRLLLDASASADTDVRARGLMGFVLMAVKHATLLPLFPELTAQLKLQADDPAWTADLVKVQAQLLLALQTKQDQRRMHEDILPELMKAASKWNERLRKGTPDPAKPDADLNPDWALEPPTEAAREKMTELMAMQERGSDTFYGTFAQVCGRTPFFNEAVNWFTPFSYDHPAFGQRGKSLAALDVLFAHHPACSTERYALLLIMQQLPEAQFKQLSASIANMAGAADPMADTLPPTTDRDTRMRQAVRFCSQDLYRFFTLFRHRNARENPFALDLRLTQYDFFRPLLSQNATLTALADFCFREKQWGQALSFFACADSNAFSAADWGKMGYAQEMEKDYAQAARCYKEVLRREPESLWTLRRLGNICIRQSDFKAALTYLEMADGLQPNNADTLLRLGECYMKVGEPELAFGLLYKADNLRPDGRALRALAWVSLQMADYEQAEVYYVRILSGTPTADDYLNAGHAAWLCGRADLAIARYKSCALQRGLNFLPPDFFEPDRELLAAGGLTADDLSLMRDAVNG